MSDPREPFFERITRLNNAEDRSAVELSLMTTANIQWYRERNPILRLLANEYIMHKQMDFTSETEALATSAAMRVRLNTIITICEEMDKQTTLTQPTHEDTPPCTLT